MPSIKKLEPPTSVGGRSIEESCGTVDDVVEEVDDVGDVEEVELVATDAAPVRGVLVLVVEDTTLIWLCPAATVVEGTGAVVGEAPNGATVVGDETGGVLVVADGAIDVELDDDELEDELEEVVFTDVSIVTTPALTVVAGPVLAEESVTEFAVSSTMTVPSDAQATPRVRTDDVDEADGEKTHEDAVPELLKSPAEIPDTCSLNITE